MVIFCLHSIIINIKVNFINVDVVYIYINSNFKNQTAEGREDKLNKFYPELLRYSLRSVLTNIDWVNRIYIITTNEKIKFLKDSEERKKKIIYLNYQDILGFNSSSKLTLEHNVLPKLNNYNVSEYIIYMNDNCFINRRLKKNDFFYYSEKEKKVVPYVMNYKNWIYHHGYDYYNKYYSNNKFLLEKRFNNSLDDISMQNAGAFILLYKYFNRTNIHVLMKEANSRNAALPICLSDLFELFNFLEEKYEFKEELFYSKILNNKQITFDICYSFYFLNKYDRLFGCINEYDVNKNNLNKYKKNMSDMFCLIKETEDGLEQFTSSLISLLNLFFYAPSVYEKNIINDGIYYIRSEKNNKLVWELNNKKNMKGTLVLKKFDGKEKQKFIIQKNKDNYFIIKNRYYKRKIGESKNTYYNTSTPNTNVTMDKKNMEWIIFPDENNSFYFRSRKNNLYIDGCNYKIFSRKKFLTMKYFSGEASQRFFLDGIK